MRLIIAKLFSSKCNGPTEKLVKQSSHALSSIE